MPAAPRVLILADPGPDLDDVKSLLLACHLHTLGKIELVGVICSGGLQAINRTKLASAVIRSGFPSLRIPVAVGSDGDKEHKPAPYEYDIAGFEESDTSLRGSDLFASVLAGSKPQSLVVLVEAAFTDLSEGIKAHGADAVKGAVRRVAAMGGIIGVGETWKPDEAFNNKLDMGAAEHVYSFCQSEGVPLTVLSRDAVPDLPLQHVRDVAKESGNPGHPVVKYLLRAQDEGLVALWGRVCRGELPPRCTKEWYFNTFCGVKGTEAFKAYCGANFGGGEPGDGVAIVEHLKGSVKPYDPLTLLTLLGEGCAAFDWDLARQGGGVAHYVFQKAESIKDFGVFKEHLRQAVLAAARVGG